MQIKIFIVFCERIRKTSTYLVKFLPNDQLNERIKSLPKETRKWNQSAMGWEIKAFSLYQIIKLYKGSTKIHFDFGNNDSRKIFIKKVEKFKIEEEEKRKIIADLEIKKKHWIKYKEELEKKYEEYSSLVHEKLNTNIKLYPHQIVGTMFLNEVRNALLALDMGTGKTSISIAYSEFNNFNKVFVITPNSLKFNYYNEVSKFTNSKAHIINWKKKQYSIEESKYIIVNYDYFNSSEFEKVQKKINKLNIGKIDCLILDECFSYDTLIDTNIGKIKIGDIVEKKINVKVLSYNHQTKKTELKSINRYLYNGNKKTIKVNLNDGSSIICTENHKFYSISRNKYIPINQFKYGEKVIKISNRNRWKFTQNKKMEIFGQKKNRNIEIVWVESIEILESGNRRKYGNSINNIEKVFDLEVEDNHNYFANGILVSNCHSISNTKSNTFKNFKRIFKNSIFRNGNVSKIFMSGTPIPSKVEQIYTILNQISPIEFATKNHFLEYYCGMKYNLDGYGWEIDEEKTKYEELFHKISPYIYRKKKSDVLKDLPEVTIQKILLEMTPNEYQTYYDIEEGVANEFITNKIMNPLTIMLKLKEYTSSLKTKNIIDLIETILNSGEKFVLVDFFKKSLNDLKEKYKAISVLHTGDEKNTEIRSKMVSDFQNNDDIKLFFGSESTIKEGLTLTIASKIGIVTIPWNPGIIEQVYSRLQRIGQKNAVNVYLFIYTNTIDEYILDIVEKKKSIISQVIDNEKYESNINEEIINDLIQLIKQKHGK